MYFLAIIFCFLLLLLFLNICWFVDSLTLHLWVTFEDRDVVLLNIESLDCGTAPRT